MDKDLKKLYDLVEKQSSFYDKTENVAIGQTWKYHIKDVIKYSTLFAQERGGDVEVVEIAALFHDYANLIDYKKYSDTHHIDSGEMAEPILLERGYSQEFINKVKKCIYSHRGSVVKEKVTVEEICLADGDAVTHIVNAFEMILWRGQLGECVEDANRFAKNKLRKTYAKLSDYAKDFINEKYNAIMQIFY